MKNKDLTLNYLNGTEIYLYQREDMFRVNTDTALLGNFIEVKSGETVLDIGTNNGALLLYASQYDYGKLIGVDVVPDAIELARKNLEFNKIANYELYCNKVQDIELDMVDVIVCNPPYFPASATMSANPMIQMAKHDTNLPLNDLFEVVQKLLKPTGRFYMVQRYSRLLDILDEVIERELGVVEIRKVVDSRTNKPTSVLLEISRKVDQDTKKSVHHIP